MRQRRPYRFAGANGNLNSEIMITNGPLPSPPDDWSSSAGGVVDLGVVRAQENGREISGIEYEAHRAWPSIRWKNRPCSTNREWTACRRRRHRNELGKPPDSWPARVNGPLRPSAQFLWIGGRTAAPSLFSSRFERLLGRGLRGRTESSRNSGS